MITIPYEKLIERMQESSKLSKDELDKKINAKLEELSGLISREGAAHIVANEIGVNFEVAQKNITISGLAAGMKNIELVGKVRAVYEVREFNTERSGKVGNFLLTDASGTTRIVLWNDMADKLKDIKEGDVIKIKEAYTRENSGRIEVHLGDNAHLYINPEGIQVNVDMTAVSEKRADAPLKKVAELNANDGNVAVVSTIVQVFDPRFFAVCPECNKKLQGEAGSYNCLSHGDVDIPTYNYVMNLYLDDGSDNIRCVLWKEQINELLGIPAAEIISLKDEPGLFEPFKTELLGMIVKVRGRVNNNVQFGRLELVAYEVTKNVSPDGEKEDSANKDSLVSEKESSSVIEKVDEGKIVEKTTETTITAEVNDETQEVESISVKEETTRTVSKEEEIVKEDTPVQNVEEEVFTLEDIEDLEDLE